MLQSVDEIMSVAPETVTCNMIYLYRVAQKYATY